MRTRSSYGQLLQGKTLAWRDLTLNVKQPDRDHTAITKICRRCGEAYTTHGYGSKWCSEECRLVAYSAERVEARIARRTRLCR